MVQNKSLEDPLKQTYRNLALGNDDFIQKIKAIIENQKNSREIPITNLTNSYHPKEIMEKICEVNQLGLERLMSKVRGNIYRSLTISLIKKLTPLKLTEIGELFDLDYSAVSQAAKRFAQKGKKDKEIERRKERVIESLK